MAVEFPLIKIHVGQEKRGKSAVNIFVLDSISKDGKGATYKQTGPVPLNLKPRVRD